MCLLLPIQFSIKLLDIVFCISFPFLGCRLIACRLRAWIIALDNQPSLSELENSSSRILHCKLTKIATYNQTQSTDALFNAKAVNSSVERFSPNFNLMCTLDTQIIIRLFFQRNNIESIFSMYIIYCIIIVSRLKPKFFTFAFTDN